MKLRPKSGEHVLMLVLASMTGAFSGVKFFDCTPKKGFPLIPGWCCELGTPRRRGGLVTEVFQPQFVDWCTVYDSMSLYIQNTA